MFPCLNHITALLKSANRDLTSVSPFVYNKKISYFFKHTSLISRHSSIIQITKKIRSTSISHRSDTFEWQDRCLIEFDPMAFAVSVYAADLNESS